MKILLLDVGNTRLKWGIGENGAIHETGAIAQQKIRDQGLATLTTRLPHDVDAVIAANVSGQTLATRLAGVIHAHCNCDIHFVKSSREAGGVRNAYSQPRRLGVDRWVAMIGAWKELGRACLVVDAGTALTIDALDDEGQHLGGQIIPGTALMARSLASDTSEIPATKATKADAAKGMQMFGKTTRAAVQNGSLNAAAGAVSRAIRTLRSNAYDAQVVLTGGGASRILTTLDEPPLHRPNLVLQGLLHLHQSQR